MAGFGIETGSAHGRGFVGQDATGVLAKFYAWVTKSYANHGPAWFIRDDFSANSPQTCAYTAVNTSTEKITLTSHGFANAHAVQISSSGTIPGGLSAGTTYFVIWIDANTIQLASSLANVYAGSPINITSQGSGNHTITPYEFFIVVSDTSSPSVNDYNTSPSGNAPKFLKVGYRVDEAGYIRVIGFMWWDVVSHYGQGRFSGYRIATYDSGDFAYDFRGGAEQLIINIRLGTTWQSARIDDFVGDTNLLEVATKVGVLQSGISSGSNVVLQLGSGQAVNFTLNNYYYIFDFSAKTWVNYCKCTNVDVGNDRITVNSLTYNFPSGSVISPFAHRYYMFGYGVNGSIDGMCFSSGLILLIPYCSSSNSGYTNYLPSIGTLYSQQALDYMSQIITRVSPDDLGFYACQKPSIVEYLDFINGQNSTNRAYGACKNFFITLKGTMAQMLDYRTIGATDWLYFDGGSTYCYLMLNTESLS